MKKVLITGSSGQVGTRLTKNLLRAGFDVVGIGTREILDATDGSNRYIKFDLLTEDVDSLIEQTRPELLIHLAWETEPNTFWASPKNILWLDSSKKLVESFNKWGGERILVAGTGAEYDWESQAPFDELGPELPKSIYGQAKLALLNVLRHQSTPFLWTRTFFQFGDKETPGRVIPSLIDTLQSGQKFSIQKPDDIRDYIYVDDVVQIMTSLIVSEKEGVFNVASGVGITMRELGMKIASNFESPDLLHFQEQSEKPSIVQANMAKLEKTLGPITYTNLDEAINKTIRERATL
jgi:nucleoside-diphosphate-sugar epimerase